MKPRRIVGVSGVVLGQATYVDVPAPPEIFEDYVLDFAEDGRCEVVVRGTGSALLAETCSGASQEICASCDAAIRR
jgi:hypothetical protein